MVLQGSLAYHVEMQIIIQLHVVVMNQILIQIVYLLVIFF